MEIVFMTRRERLMATLKGEPVDRPPVSFYEINGLDEDPHDQDPFNIYNHPSWQPLIELAREKSDRIVMRGAVFNSVQPDPVADLTDSETTVRGDRSFTIHRIRIDPHRVLTMQTRKDKDVNTIWTTEHLLKTKEDLEAFLELSPVRPHDHVDKDSVLKAEAELGDSGIVMMDTPDPLCLAASLFDLGTFTILALTEQKLFHRLLERFAEFLYPMIFKAAQELPGRLWRIYGPEYASPPYLPPDLFRDYVCRYDQAIVDAIKQHGGYARIHSHGNLYAILDHIAAMNVDGLDPIEPPPQGDVQLDYVRRHYGKEWVLFGNLQISGIENLPTPQFATQVSQALEQGTRYPGRGFVLMPTACPYGRILEPLTLDNYIKMIDIIETGF
jgi:hypothetical protein